MHLGAEAFKFNDRLFQLFQFLKKGLCWRHQILSQSFDTFAISIICLFETPCKVLLNITQNFLEKHFTTQKALAMEVLASVANSIFTEILRFPPPPPKCISRPPQLLSICASW